MDELSAPGVSALRQAQDTIIKFLGARQSGVPMLRFANLEEDLHLLEQAREIAPMLIEQNPEIVEAHLARWLASREGYLGV